MRKRDALAGAMLLNTIPHTIMGLAGKRCMTPLGGANSSPTLNLIWAGINVVGGAAALAPSGWRTIDQRTAEERLRAVTFGVVGMATFAAAYEVSPTAARRRLERVEGGSP